MITILDTSLMAERLKAKMIEKGFVHKNGNPHQKMFAEALGDRKLQPLISSILNETQKQIREEPLTRIARGLNCQELWLIGGEYVPLQEKPLFKEELYQPEEKIAEIGNSSILGALESIGEALYMIMRQLQKLNAREEEKNG